MPTLGLNKGPQREAFHSRKANEILYGGAAAGGKSHLLRVLAVTWCYQVPGIQGYLFRRTYPELMMNHLEGPQSLQAMTADWQQLGLCHWNWGRHELEFWNGARLHLRHCKHENDVYAYHGGELHFALFDELTTFTAFQYRYIRSRVRCPGLVVPPECPWTFPRITAGSNPGNIGHNWVKANWVSPAPPFKVWRAEKKEGGMLRQYIPARLSDNPFVFVDDPDYIHKLHGLGDEHLVKAMVEGDWDIVAGGMFDDVWQLDRNTHAQVILPDNAILHRSFDWGSSAPFSVGWWLTCSGEEYELADGSRRTWPKGHRVRISEWYGWNGTENEGCRMDEVAIAQGILEREEALGIKGRVLPGAADSSIWDTDRGTSIGDTMEAAGVSFEPADKSPGSRVNGWALMRRMMKAAHQVPQEKPGLTVVADTCRHFIRCVPVLPRDEKKRDDVKDGAEDHNADDCRYELSRATGTAVRVPMTGA